MTIRDRFGRFAVLFLLPWFSPAAAAEAPPSLSDPARRDLLPSPASVTGGAVGGLVNPAAWSAGGGLAFWWSDDQHRKNSLDNWGLTSSGPLAFTVERRTFAGETGPGRLYDYQLGFSGGDRSAHVGLGWRWSTGDRVRGHESGLVIGSISRPSPALTLGSSFFLSSASGYRSGVVDLGVRPLRGHSALTLFADYSLTDRDRLQDGTWSAGAEVRPVRGLHVGGRFIDPGDSDRNRWALNFGIAFDDLGFHVLPDYDDDGNRGTTSYVLRAAPPYAGLPLGSWVRDLAGTRRWEMIDLEHRVVTYQRHIWFDDRNVAWIDLAQKLRKLRDDPEVDGILLNLAGTRVRPSLLWELRRELEACRSSGKTIAIHVHEVGIGGYYLASVADRITIDPMGELTLAGVAAHRTYVAGLLDKLGIGFEEHRYFEYKTAAERYSRADMSDPDREQLGRMVDVLYETFRDGICASRGLAPDELDAIVNDRTMLFAGEAKELGLVDGIGRWDDLKKWVRDQDVTLGSTGIVERIRPDERWGRPPVVSLVYARGLCAMDTGIRARETSRYLRRTARRRDVAAVVVRADSPGGYPLPSDLFADGMRDVREKGKPLVVSQGDLAASGGYRISVDSDRIFTTPLTVTGSIGVISGWAWNDGFGEKTGLSADGVQRGDHADLFTGIRLPIVGGPLPGRNLTDAEKARAKGLTMEIYSDFVGKVSDRRGLPEESVLEVAEGRIWMGEDAIERGLADEIGTLSDAIADARQRAGLAPDAEILVEEFPPRGRFRLPDFVPPSLASWLGTTPEGEPEREDYALEYLRAVLARQGGALLLVPPDHLPHDWVDW